MRPAVSKMTSSNSGMLPPTKPVLPPCRHQTFSANGATDAQHATAMLRYRCCKLLEKALTCGTIARRLSLQYARTLETCSVLLGRNASLLFPAYLPIQSLQCHHLSFSPWIMSTLSTTSTSGTTRRASPQCRAIALTHSRAVERLCL